MSKDEDVIKWYAKHRAWNDWHMMMCNKIGCIKDGERTCIGSNRNCPYEVILYEARA